jgi:hypothetical protein
MSGFTSAADFQAQYAQEANAVLKDRTGECVSKRRWAVGVYVNFSDGAHCGEVLHHAC